MAASTSATPVTMSVRPVRHGLSVVYRAHRYPVQNSKKIRIAFEIRSAVQASSTKRNGSVAGMLAKNTSQKLAIAPKNPRGHAERPEARGSHIARHAPVELGAVRIFASRADQPVQLLPDDGGGLFLGGGVPDQGPHARKSPAFEDLPADVQRAIDDAPGDVAADRGDEQLPSGPGFVPHDQARREREGQGHDESEQDLAKALARSELFLGERQREAGHREFRGDADAANGGACADRGIRAAKKVPEDADAGTERPT